MERRSPEQRFWLFSLAFTILFAGFGRSNPQSRTTTLPEPFDAARLLLEAAFPELTGSNEPFVISVRTPFNRDWRLPSEFFVRALNRRRIVREDGLVVSSEHERLWSHFLFSRTRLDSAQFSGSTVDRGSDAHSTPDAPARALSRRMLRRASEPCE